MPDDPLVWIIALLVGGVVLIVALSLGGVVDIGLKPLRLSFRRKETPKAPQRERVSVLDEAQLHDVEAGNVTGVSQDAGSRGETGIARDVDVGRKAKIRGGKLGDISGVTVAAPAKDNVPRKSPASEDAGRD